MSVKKRRAKKAHEHDRHAMRRANEAKARQQAYIRSVTEPGTIMRGPTPAELERLTITTGNDSPRTLLTLTEHCCPKGHATAFLKRGEECPRCLRLQRSHKAATRRH